MSKIKDQLLEEQQEENENLDLTYWELKELEKDLGIKTMPKKQYPTWNEWNDDPWEVYRNSMRGEN